MKLTFLTLTMAAQLAATVAMAQTSDATTATTGTTAAQGTFGSDWSTSLGSAMFGEDGSTVRPVNEIEAQWQTLSEEDRNMIRRDCMVFMQGSGGSMGSDTADTSAADTSVTGDATVGNDTAVGTGTDATGTDVPDTDTTGSADAADAEMPNAEASSTTENSVAGETTLTGMLDVSPENMQAICASTANL